MSIIRTFREGDIDAIARLHQEVFPPDTGPAELDVYRTYFRDTFLTGPRADREIASLVCEDDDRSLIGFLGVIPFRMAVDGRPIWATVSTQFCVDPRRRGMTGLKLLRHHLSGPQDLSISDEANAITLRLWSFAGGEAVTSCSLHFLRPLRPAALALSLAAARRPGLARVARGMAVPARLVDSVLARVPQTRLRPPVPQTRGESLDASTMVAALPEIARERQVVPLYEPDALAWYLQRAQAIPGGDVQRVLVRNRKGKLLGWYIYDRVPDGTAQLLQLAAPAEAARDVLDHLLYDAWQAGMIVVQGRLDPALAQVYSDRFCLFSRRGPWMLVHARDPALVHRFHRGEALFSPLDGEYCMRFKPRPG
ncbi:MAG: hypothetical protein JWP01_3605 [Myxococcales bacterium]|nr:hypothetical protein [Myxococcales bacterium]